MAHVKQEAKNSGEAESWGKDGGSTPLIWSSTCVHYMKTGERDKRTFGSLLRAPYHGILWQQSVLFLSLARHSWGMKCEGENLNSVFTSCPLPSTELGVPPQECKMTSYFYLPHCNNIFNYGLNCKCPMSHLNKSHLYEIVNCVLRAIPSCKNRPTLKCTFFLQLIENTAHIMHELKHPGGISICIPCFKMYNQMLS